MSDWQCTASTKDDAIECIASMLDNPWGIKTALRKYEYWDEPGEHNLYYATIRIEYLTQEEIDAINETY